MEHVVKITWATLSMARLANLKTILMILPTLRSLEKNAEFVGMRLSNVFFTLVDTCVYVGIGKKPPHAPFFKFHQ